MTPRLWQVTASVVTNKGGWTSTHQVPTFFIDPLIQGAMTEEAASKIAYDILSAGSAGVVEVHSDIVPVD